MPCAIKNCKIKSNLNPKTGLCASCDQCFNGIARRMQSQERQSVARDQVHAQHRRGREAVADVGSDDETGVGLPKVDLGQLINSHKMMGSEDADIDSSKVLKDILGVVLNMYAKSEDIDNLKNVSEENSYRISQLEAKVGRSDEVALPLGLAVRNLPLPSEGSTELDNIRLAFKEIAAPGVDVKNDVIKAIRVGYRAESEPGANNLNLGTVKVEMRTEECRAAVMKTKYQLKNHPQLVMRNLVVQNLKSRDEMKNENFHYDILKMVTKSNDFYVGGNGHIRRRDQNPSSQTRNLDAGRPQPQPQPQYTYAPRAPYSQLPHVPPPQRGILHQHVPRHPLPLNPTAGPSLRQQASLLDIDNVFNFGPIQNDNPYRAPDTSIPPPIHGDPHGSSAVGGTVQQGPRVPDQEQVATGHVQGNKYGQ